MPSRFTYFITFYLKTNQCQKNNTHLENNFKNGDVTLKQYFFSLKLMSYTHTQNVFRITTNEQNLVDITILVSLLE